MNNQEIENIAKQIEILHCMLTLHWISDTQMIAIHTAISLLQQQLNNGWIPVSDRMPTKEEYNENDGRFIVTDGQRKYQSLYDIYEGKGFVDIIYLGRCNFAENTDERVIAWQPFPKIQKEDINAKENHT